MNRINKVSSAIAIGAFFVLAPAQDAAAADLIVGTGSTQGVYYQVGRTICRIIERVDPIDGANCQVLSTPGSISNLQEIRSGALHIGVVQSDWQHDAVLGEGRFAEAGPDTELRALFSAHTEPFTLVARRDSGIASLADLAGRRVNIGNPGSGQRGTMEAVMAAMGWTADDFSLAAQLTASEHSFALCNDRVEAIVYTVGHPNPSISKATGLCDATIVPVTGPEIDALVDSSPFYIKTEVPAGIYPANPDPVETFGVIATVVVPASLDEDLVYQIVSRVFRNLDDVRASHPAFGGLDPANMVSVGLSAPLHPGAQRYYVEQGLLTAPAPGN